MAQITEIVSKEAIQGLLDTDKAVSSVDDNIMKMNTSLNDLLDTFSKVTKSQDDYTKAQEETAKQIEENDKIEKKLITTNEKLAELEDDRTTQIIRNQEQLKEQRKQIRDNIKAEKDQAGSINELRRETKELIIQRNRLTTRTKEGRAEIAKLNAQIDANTDTISDNSDSLNKQRLNIGNYKSALEGIPGPIGNVTRSSNTLLNTLKLITKVPLVLLITAVVGGLTTLFAAFKKTQAGADAFRKVFAQVSAVADEIIGRIAAMGEALGNLARLRFKEAKKNAKEAFTGIKDGVQGAAKAAREIEDLKISIFEDETAFLKKSAERRRQIAELVQASKEEERSFREREAALRSANELEVSNLKSGIALQERRVQLARDEIAATPERLRTREQERTLVEQLAQLDELRRESSNRQRELNNRLIELANKERGEINGKLNAEKRVTAEREKQQAELEKQAMKRRGIARDTAEAIKVLETSVDDFILAEEIKLQNELTKILEEGLTERLEKEQEANKQTLLDRKEMQQKIEELGRAVVLEGVNAVFDIRSNALDKELQDIQLAKEKELAIAGDNEAARERIEERFLKKEEEIKLKQFKNNRNQSLANIGLSTSTGHGQLG